MTKREQVVAEDMKNQQPAQETEKEVQAIAQARVAYEQLIEEIRGYSRQARELREQAAELQQSGRTDFQVRDR
ncbi:hypothetical protein ACWHAM_26350 [Paenibacillus terrae]